MTRTISLILAALVVAGGAAGQTDEDPAFRPPGEQTVRNTGPVSVSVGGTVVAPAWIGGDPGVGFGLQTLSVFHLGPRDRNLESTNRALLLYTLKGRWRLHNRTDLYWGENLWHVRVEPQYDGLRTGFYGLGNPAPLEDPEYYEPSSLRLETGIFRRFYRRLQIGLVADVQYHEVSHNESGGFLETRPELVGQDGWVIGSGLAFAYDSRDRVFDPRRGLFASWSAIGFPDEIGGKYSFTDYEVDVRTYLAVAARHTLAVQGYAALSRGETPFWRLPSVGDLPHSRAYDPHRLRDKTLGGLQVEWRWRWSPRFGAEVFAGAVGLSETLTDLQLREMRPSIGASLRMYQDMGGDIVPMRFGGAWGDDGWRLVIGVGDAF